MSKTSIRHCRPRHVLRAPRHAVTLGLLAVLAACGGEAGPGGTAQPQALPPAPVTVAELAPRTVAVRAEYAGRVRAVREVEVRARIAGILEERLYVEGERVQEGTPLFRIDREPFEIALQRALAEQEDAAASLEQAERERRRMEALYERRSVSERERDDAQTAHRLAQARLELADAAVADARRSLRYAEVRAPVDGVTGLEILPEGSLVEVGTLLTTITQLDPVYVRFSLPEEDVRRQRASADGEHPPRLRLPDGRAYELAGRVDFTDSTVDPRTGTVSARAVFPNPDGELIPGQFARVELLIEQLTDVFVVDPTTVGQGPEGPRVFVVENGTAHARPVSLGPLVDAGQVVLAGLRPGEQLVTNGQVALADGAPVAARPADGAER